MKLENQQHLKEISTLYSKVCAFERAVHLKHSYHPVHDAHRKYIDEDVDTVIRAFSETFGLDQEDSESLRESIQSQETDFMLLPNNSASMQNEAFSFLFIISRPFFHSMKHFLNIDNMNWQDGRCTVCNAVPSLSILEKETNRKYYCSFCGSIGHFKRIGCPNCHNENPEKINILYRDGNDDIRIDTCTACKSYVKTFQSDLLRDAPIDEIDLISLPFDIVAQSRGFSRRSPNTIGMMKIQ
jgi:formate dehydrogenase maturation protein FdhE